MSQTQDHTPTERAEHLLDRAGERIGFFAANSGKRLQELTVRRFGRPHQPPQAPKTPGEGFVGDTSTTSTPSGEKPPPTIEKAEEMVDTMGQRFSLIGAIVGLQSQRMGVRIREQFEDMWAEAQQIRHTRR